MKDKLKRFWQGFWSNGIRWIYLVLGLSSWTGIYFLYQLYLLDRRNPFVVVGIVVCGIVGGFLLYRAWRSGGYVEAAKDASGKLTGPANCLNIYPKHLGGVKYERIETDKIDPSADPWRKAETGKYYYLHKYDPETEALVPYYPLPEVIEIGADYVARMMSCPYIRLKSLKIGVWAQLKEWIPFLVLGLSFLSMVIFMGGD